MSSIRVVTDLNVNLSSGVMYSFILPKYILTMEILLCL